MSHHLRLGVLLVVLLASLAWGDDSKPDGRTLKRSVVHIKERTQTVKASTQTRLTITKGDSE